MVAGVAGGLGHYFNVNPLLYRVGFVVLTLLGGAGILIYLAAVLVMPEEGKEDSFAARVLRERSDRPWPLVGLALVAIAGAVLLSRATLWHAASLRLRSDGSAGLTRCVAVSSPASDSVGISVSRQRICASSGAGRR